MSSNINNMSSKIDNISSHIDNMAIPSILGHDLANQQIAQQAENDAEQPRKQNSYFPFLRLPFDIRQIVYSYMLAGKGRCVMIDDLEVVNQIYSSEPSAAKRFWAGRSRPCWDKLSPDEDWCFVPSDVYIEIDVAVLRTCRQIYEEAEPILYRSHDFSFRTELTCAVAFLESLTDRARRNIRCIGMALRRYYSGDLSPNIEFDRNWSLACKYVAENLQLHELIFNLELAVSPAGFENYPYIQDLLKIKNLRRLTQLPLYGVPDQPRPHALDENGNYVWVGDREVTKRLSALLQILVERMVLEKWAPKNQTQWRPDPPTYCCDLYGPGHNCYKFEPTESQPTDYLPEFA